MSGEKSVKPPRCSKNRKKTVSPISIFRHTSLIVLLLLVSLSSSSRDSSSSSRHSPLAPHLLGQPGPHQQKLGPGPSIAQVKPSERVNRAVTRSDSDSDVSRSISPPSFSPQCLDKNSNCKKNATSEPASRRKQAAKEVCKLPPKLRTSAALSHPDFVSTCWAHSDCPPPVLTASQVVDIEGGEVETCRRAVDRLLVQVEEVVMRIVITGQTPAHSVARLIFMILMILIMLILLIMVMQVEERSLQVESALHVLTSAWLVPGQKQCGRQACPDCKVNTSSSSPL